MDGYRTLARFGLFAGLIAAEVYLARDLVSGGNSAIGYTETRSYAVAPQRRAKVRSLAVQLGAPVKTGDLIAELDPTEIDREIEVATAERDRSIAAIRAEVTTAHQTMAVTETKFATVTERANVDLAAAIATARTAAAELAAVETDLAGQRVLVEKHLADATKLQSLELKRAGLAKQVELAENVIAILRGNAGNAAKRTADLDRAASHATVAPLEASLHAVEVRLDQLGRERRALTVYAPVDGVVDQLPLRVGDLAGPDLPVATVVATDPRRIVACVPEARVGTVAVGVEVTTTSLFARARGEGAVESITSEIAPLPARCQPAGSKVPALGRLAVVALDEPLGGGAGESQIVHFQARRRTPRRTPTAPPVAVSAPARMQVPGALLARTRFEPSGIVWVASLARYVIVSDDTGFNKRDEHAPWLFTMSLDGVVDPDPIVVGGIDKLDDVESIALGADGALWLLASQSVSRKGNRSPARQRLLRVVLKGREARADGFVEVAELLDAAPLATRRALGVEDSRALDIEAMAIRDGVLYFGLKSPIDGAGAAVIWKIGSPARLLARDLAGADVAVWSRLKLVVEADGRSAPGGIADMAFAGDTLVITATASGEPRTQNGALFVAKLTKTELRPQLVRTFEGLKPEGIALTPNKDALVIVFDRGSEPALWLQLPLDQTLRDAR